MIGVGKDFRKWENGGERHYLVVGGETNFINWKDGVWLFLSVSDHCVNRGGYLNVYLCNNTEGGRNVERSLEDLSMCSIRIFVDGAYTIR